MNLKVQHIMDAFPVIVGIINSGRPLPQKGAYRLARLHAKLQPEFKVANDQREGLIKAYDHHPMVAAPKPLAEEFDGKAPEMVPAEHFAVPADKMDEFTAAWSVIAGEDVEVDVQPIPLAQVDAGDDKAACISASELVILGSLVAE